MADPYSATAGLVQAIASMPVVNKALERAFDKATEKTKLKSKKLSLQIQRSFPGISY